MLALTVRQPYAWCIAAGHKRIENRPWAPPASVVGDYIAIHAGLEEFTDAFAAIKRIHGLRIGSGELAYGAIVALAVVDSVVTESKDPWFFGPFGWVLRDVVAIRPVKCRGAQGLWTVPPSVVPELLLRLDEPPPVLGALPPKRSFDAPFSPARAASRTAAGGAPPRDGPRQLEQRGGATAHPAKDSGRPSAAVRTSGRGAR